ncbi:rplO [Symbiodinium sp. KB8]|nr:rplO [Symbiodinium sp. KB8]
MATAARAAPRLNELRDNPGAKANSRPLGRGPGTGKGKTSGRGHKGRRARSGGSVRLGFEGGQTPLYLRLPKFGFNRKDLQEPLEELTLGRLQLLIDQGRIDASKRITIADIAKSGAVSRVRHGIKVLGAEHLTATLDLEVTQVSKGAIEAIEGRGGKIRTVYHGQTYLRYMLNPERWVAKGRLPPKNPRPALKRIGYWLNWENRGYLAPEAQLDDIMAARAGQEEAASADGVADERA